MSLLKPQLPFVNDRNGLGIPILPNLPESLPFTPGNIWHVRPRLGSDVGSSGKNPQSAFKSLRRALQVAVADQNDVVLLYGEGNDKAKCSDTLATQLDWNKDFVHLIGVHSGVSLSPRARIEAASAYAVAAPIFTVSASGCLIANVEVVLEVASATPLGAASVTGQRNKFVGCHFYGFAATVSDVVGGYSLLLSGAEENEFHNCQIGSDRIQLGASANSQLKIASLCKNNRFKDCILRMWTSSATNHVFVRVPTGALQGTLVFQNTIGINSKHVSGGTELTYGLIVASDAGGDVILDVTSAFQAADVNNDSGNVYGAGASAGILVPVIK